MADDAPIDKFKLPAFKDQAPPERYDEIDALLSKAESEGVIAPLPGSEEEVRSKELLESRIRTIRTRLYLLGYLVTNNNSPIIDDQLKGAIKEFQSEAALEADSWVGPITWKALQELVGFEHASNLKGWFAKEPLNPALMRAIGLRLYVLGLCGEQEKKDRNFQQALKKFVRIAGILKLSDRSISPAPEYETINVLFDQDRLTEQLGNTGVDFMRFRPAGIGKAAAARTIRKFVNNCAKIELWLLGYDDIALNGQYKYRKPPSRELVTYSRHDYPLFHALYLFWREKGFSKNKARSKAFDINGDFFIELVKVQQEGAQVEEPNQSDRIYQVLVDENVSFHDQVWDQIKKIGSRIWDGLKRVWRWFKAMVTKVAEQLTVWAKNIARLAYQYALNSFVIIKRFITATRKSISFLMHDRLPVSNVHHIEIGRDGDFDFRIYVNPEFNAARLEESLTAFHVEASLFKIGMRLIGMLGNILITVAKNVIRAAGWFGLILALVKIYSKLKEIVEILDEEQVFLAEL